MVYLPQQQIYSRHFIHFSFTNKWENTQASECIAARPKFRQTQFFDQVRCGLTAPSAYSAPSPSFLDTMLLLTLLFDLALNLKQSVQNSHLWAISSLQICSIWYTQVNE